MTRARGRSGGTGRRDPVDSPVCCGGGRRCCAAGWRARLARTSVGLEVKDTPHAGPGDFPSCVLTAGVPYPDSTDPRRETSAVFITTKCG